MEPRAPTLSTPTRAQVRPVIREPTVTKTSTSVQMIRARMEPRATTLSTPPRAHVRPGMGDSTVTKVLFV
ncbi:hypothetical protein DPMN_194628 [Dreissena polymorpha]|uniref:Uncharacterized protein n=1 Tax=Dreissena polymorpha TaxID=45954 RepID=A0A9D3XYV3_DREPO|nr:hypothetical protein DPMN_194628 [Dreissena polymorpha]